MKTIATIQQDIKDITYRIQHVELKKGEEKRLRKRIPFLKTCIMYLESEPKRDFIKQEIERIGTKIDLRMAEFVLDETNVDKRTANRLKRQHEKKYDIPHLKEQLRTLRFILN